MHKQSFRRRDVSFVTLFLTCLVAGGLFADDTVNLSYPLPVKQPLLVTIKSTYKKGSVKVETRLYDWADKFEYSSDIIFIDEHLEHGENIEKATRWYYRYKALRNKEIADSPLSGVEATFEWDEKEEDWSIELGGDRALSDELFDDLSAHTTSLGVYANFPDKVRVGQKFDVDLDLLTPLAIEADRKYDSKGKLKLESYDAETGLAKLKGTVTFSGERELDGTRTFVSSTGTAEFEVQVKQQHIAAMNYTGKFEFKRGLEGAKVSGKADHTVTLTGSVKEQRVEAARKRKPVFRTRKIRMPNIGVGIKLPTFWCSLGGDENSHAFTRTADFSKGTATIDLSFLSGDSSYQPAGYFDQFYANLKQEYPNLVMKKTKNPLDRGEGRLYFIPPNDKSDRLLHAEIYPYKGKFFMFRLFTSKQAYNKAVKEFKQAKNTLGRLNLKKKKR